jgi:hypothetical protein
MSAEYPNKKVHALIFSSATANFDKRDWMALALAALDQAGLTPAEYDGIEKLLPEVAGDVGAA